MRDLRTQLYRSRSIPYNVPLGYFIEEELNMKKRNMVVFLLIISAFFYVLLPEESPDEGH